MRKERQLVRSAENTAIINTSLKKENIYSMY